MKWIPIIAAGAVASIALAGCATPGSDRATTKPRVERSTIMRMSSDGPTGFLDKTMTVNGAARRYAVYVPYDYDPAQTWPLIVFLHGKGERGDDGLKQTAIGLGQAIRLNPERFPCLVVMPQCPDTGWWDAARDDVLLSVNRTREEYTIDPDRIYLTGLSMGGYATWIFGAAVPDTFAALMPICGGGQPEDAAKLAATPVWAFHGAADETVKPDESRRMVEAVKKAGGKVQYTEYKGVGHNSWDNAYGDPKAIKWLLSQRKNP
jgi:predicted peptidase